MVKPVIFAVIRIQYFPRQDSDSRLRNHPNLHFTSRRMDKGLKFAVDSAGREIVVDKTTVTGCALVCVNVPFVRDERSQIGRVIVRADSDRVTYARAKVGTYSQFSWTPSGLYTFSIIDRCVELTLPRRTGYGICSA